MRKSNPQAVVTVLGSGTSTGVPVPACKCPVCASTNPKNQRLRSSIFIEGPEGNILIDCGPDFRTQSLKYNIVAIDKVLITHTHADHIFGMDDLRCFNFASGNTIELFAGSEHRAELERIFRYTFSPDLSYEGGALPKLQLKNLIAFQPLHLCGMRIIPLPLLHGTGRSYGFRIGDFAYLTDCSEIPDQTLEALPGLSFLILDGLRQRPHRTHFSHAEAVQQIDRIQPKMTYLTHISHEVDHDSGNTELSRISSHPVELAYDGLQLTVEV